MHKEKRSIIWLALSFALSLVAPNLALARESPWEPQLDRLFTLLTQWYRPAARELFTEIVQQYESQGVLGDKRFRSLQAYLAAMTPYCEYQGGDDYLTHYRFGEAFQILDEAMTGEVDDAPLLGWKVYLGWYARLPADSIRDIAAQCVAHADAWLAREPNNPDANLWAGSCRTWLEPLWTTETNEYFERAIANGANLRHATLLRGIMFLFARNWDAAVQGMEMRDYIEAMYWYGVIQGQRDEKPELCEAMSVVNFFAPSFWRREHVIRLQGACRDPDIKHWKCRDEPIPCAASCSNKQCGEPDGCGGICRVGSGCLSNALAKGVLGMITSAGEARGWACDPNHPEVSVWVEFFGARDEYGRTIANQPSPPAVQASCKGGASHHFRFQLPRRAEGRFVFAQVTDLDDHTTRQLSNSPKQWILAPPKPRRLRFTPVADAYVDVTNPTQNYGAESHLAVQNADSGNQKHGYLRFHVRGIDPGARVRSATLRVRSKWWPIRSLSVYQIQDWPWNENSLNYRNASLAALWAKWGIPVAAGAWVEIDVTPTVGADGHVTYGLAQGEDFFRLIWSKESPFPPELIVVTQ